MRTILAAALAGLVLSAGVAHAGDPDKGKSVFNKCKSCHMIGPNAKTRVGPELNGIVGRPMGSVEGFHYSKELKEMGEAGGVWDADKLNAYIKKPKAMIPHGRMPFPGLANDQQRDDLVAYLKQFAADGSQAQ
ncbi:MAG: cytochrome c family protein [Alphaproteobacteria bacterium]|nr:cytochrome c family protein [Alphaproteobacteria bacterium]MCB9930538.1 cytochrome c family protein [Alphaproteobacteria bacterium]